jgi:integrative and conjugative element protein (TIGR02256 family)
MGNSSGAYSSERPVFLRAQHIQQGKNAPEQGGILLGSVSKPKLLVEKASLPSHFDKSNRYGFERDARVAQLLVEYEHKNSGGAIIYLGEWHTHPENDPTLSRQDWKMIEKQWKDGKLLTWGLVMVIIGLKSNYCCI